MLSTRELMLKTLVLLTLGMGIWVAGSASAQDQSEVDGSELVSKEGEGAVSTKNPAPSSANPVPSSRMNKEDFLTLLSALAQASQTPTKDQNSVEKTLVFVIPVAAAFLGAILTFFATQYTERRNWHRAQRDAQCEKQFSSIANAAKHIGEAVSDVQTIRSTLVDLLKGMKNSPVEEQATIIEIESKRPSWTAVLSESSSTLALAVVELKLVDAPDHVINSVGRMLDALSLFARSIENFDASVKSDGSKELSSLATQVAAEAEQFIVVAKTHHRTFYE